MNKREEGVRAIITAIHGGDVYSMELEDGKEIKGKRSGKMKLHKIGVVVGDKVRVVVDPYGGNATNRIVYREK